MMEHTMGPTSNRVCFRPVVAVVTLFAFVGAGVLPLSAWADDEPKCTTTTTTTTTCTGTAAPLAAQPPASVVPVAPSLYPAPPPGYRLLPDITYHYEERPLTGMAVAGGAMFGGMYMFTAFLGGVTEKSALYIPVAGPIVFAASRDFDRTIQGWLIFDSLVQLTGLALLIGGLAAHHRVKVRDEPKLSVLPSASPMGAGLVAVGHF